MHQHLVARCAETLQRGDQPAEHAVLVADMLRLQIRNAVVASLPLDDLGEVLLARLEVPERRMLHALD